MDRFEMDTTKAISWENRIVRLISDTNEDYSLSSVLTEALSHPDTDPNQFVPALRVLTRRLAERQKNISDLDETVNKLWEDREKATATQLNP